MDMCVCVFVYFYYTEIILDNPIIMGREYFVV